MTGPFSPRPPWQFASLFKLERSRLVELLTSLGPPDWIWSTTTKMTGTIIAAPSPRYVRFCASSFAISHL